MLWYCVQSESRKELYASNNLKKQEIHVYYPVYCKQVRHARSITPTAKPFFPGYLFVRIPQPQFISQVKRTKGVRCLISAGHEPLSVPATLIQCLKDLEDEQGYINLNHNRFQQGDLIQITEGALSGLEGVFHSSLDNQRAMLLVHFMGNLQKIKVGLKEIDRRSA